ncbi:MAG TPA: hypothetical protein VFV72_12430 [Candidatus Limnocylindrales bacterium]|nr:hypothetical protein [Candidatus Limnocylindrales bacterium]
MSASATTAQAGIGLGGFKSALAALALVVILAATVAVVALGVSRSAAPAAEVNSIQAPAVLDKGSRDEMGVPAVPFRNDGIPSYGGWNPGSYQIPAAPGKGGHGTRIAQ